MCTDCFLLQIIVCIVIKYMSSLYCLERERLTCLVKLEPQLIYIILIVFNIQTESDEFPRITVPQRMIEHLEKQNVRIAKRTAVKYRQRLKTLVISSRKTEHQYYKGQKFNVFDPRQLASHGWKNRKCNYDFFSLVSHKPVSILHSGGDSETTTKESFILSFHTAG